MTRVILVRHSEANCNVNDTWAGHAGCTGLTPRGRDDSVTVTARLRAIVPDLEHIALASSLMPRAIETAQIIAGCLGLGRPIESLCGLCERHPGKLDGIPNRAVRAAIADDHPDARTVEPVGAFLLRTHRALTRLALAHEDRTVVAVTHTGVIAASFWVYGRVSAKVPFTVPPDNASITAWRSRKGDDMHWRLERHNS
jgi:probable phosphoglycerate mutase